MQVASHKAASSSSKASSEDPHVGDSRRYSESVADNDNDNDNDNDDDDNDIEDDNDNDDQDKNTGDADEQDDNEANKQPRLMRACDNCRRKKVKCDGSKPSCSHCTRMKLACHYSPLVRKKRVRRSIIEKLEERLESMEQMLQPLVERLSPTDPVVGPIQNQFAPGFAPFIQPQQQIYIPQPGAQGIPREPYYRQPSFGLQPPVTIHPAFQLPPPHIIEEMMEIAITRITPMAPPVSWVRQLKRFHSGQLPEFTICAIIALAARFSNRPEFMCTPKYNAGREYAKRSAELISGLVDRPDPDVVECLIMLSFYEWGCGRGESAWTYTGMATRLAQRCRLHLVDEEDFNENASSNSRSWADTEWRRRLWWHVYCSDRISIVVASRPATVHDDDCVVNLPSHDHDWIMGTIPDEDKQPAHINMEETWVPNQFSTRIPDCWWMAIEMYRIGGRIAEFANRRRRPVRPSDLSRRATFDALDKELESIRGRFIPYLEFPPRTEWLLSGYANLGDGTNGMTNICAIYFNLHIMYYGAKIILYRSEMPSYAYEKISPEMIQRAKAVCIEAAHKQADVIRWAMESVPVEYWDPKIGIWSLQGASIHVNAALCDDSAIAEQSRRDLEVHLKMHVAADQFYHFNMAMITMLHHVFNLRKKQRLLTANKVQRYQRGWRLGAAD
ncbi:hypothetical protein DL89DRAFT_179021 [Linderina pennispora]|uniref:Zn(2)-C6 fungal-type domain-containing protein n=1 Tax=Linderina pennispora TaxID=61395 RepID=A0A1Y1W549_9FUNG|nr:uncharacterized protein DL89DRAFT_179021 [Linderina pennispora]ORX68518.1 hypothetical protein DL89DRAFT_179021 [Linderina pennispora]